MVLVSSMVVRFASLLLFMLHGATQSVAWEQNATNALINTKRICPTTKPRPFAVVLLYLRSKRVMMVHVRFVNIQQQLIRSAMLMVVVVVAWLCQTPSSKNATPQRREKLSRGDVTQNLDTFTWSARCDCR